MMACKGTKKKKKKTGKHFTIDPDVKVKRKGKRQDMQHPNHITSSRWIVLRNLRQWVKKKKC